jgi:hypothetical protein
LCLAGDIDPRVRAILRAMGFQIILWNRDSNDWCYNNNPPSAPCDPNSNPSSIPTLFRTWTQQGGGAISLQHDLFLVTSQQIAPVLNVMRTSNYNLQTVAECLNTPAYDESIWEKINREAESSNVSPNPKPPTKIKVQSPLPVVSSTHSYRNTFVFGFIQALFVILPIALLFDLAI